ncbi:MAG: tRNA threonylcarbamoyladenosine dehydratase [Rugosibacter sp.]|nr:tRNA threonylcarbamoyladenosine dehydratase [Rugosibacter sp.]
MPSPSVLSHSKNLSIASQVGDDTRRFAGVDRLYGAGALARATAAHVVVVGIGGVGSWAAEALARSGVGQITLIDLDHIAASNINRQIHALEATLGAAKVEVMAARIRQINPACQVHCIEEFVDEANVAALIPACDAVIDAIDNVRAKAALIAHCRQQKITIVTTGGAGGRLDPTQIQAIDLSRTTQDALASKVRARLRKEYGFTRDPKKKFGVVCVFSPEQIKRPAIECEITDVESSMSVEAEELDALALDGGAGLSCAGYGSSVAVTAGFGFAAAARVLAGILLAP